MPPFVPISPIALPFNPVRFTWLATPPRGGTPARGCPAPGAMHAGPRRRRSSPPPPSPPLSPSPDRRNGSPHPTGPRHTAPQASSSLNPLDGPPFARPPLMNARTTPRRIVNRFAPGTHRNGAPLPSPLSHLISPLTTSPPFDLLCSSSFV